MERYFKPLRDQTQKLPDPDGALSRMVPRKGIQLANQCVEATISIGKKRSEYQKVSAQLKTKIGKYAAENGIKAAVRRYKEQVPNAPENWKNTVRDWKNGYVLELKKRKAGSTEDVHLPEKKRGRPLMLGSELDRQVQEYVKELRKAHATVNTKIVLSAAEGIVQGHDASLLASNGGTIDLTKSWAKSVMQRMGLSKRKATTQSSLSNYDFDKVREIFLNDVFVITVMEDIPASLIINWDQTGTHFVPVSQWTMEVKGSRRVELAGLNNKRQMTLVLAGTANGEFLPPQLIYSGSTSKCLPKNVNFPSDWHLTSTPTHWSNEETMLAYINRIIVPYVQSKRKEFHLSPSFPALVLFDHFSGQTSQAIFDALGKHKLLYVLIPKTCTDRLQPMDLPVNKPIKTHLQSSFQKWYVSQIQKQIVQAPNSSLTPVDTRLSVIKPIHAQWLVDAYNSTKNRPDIIVNGFRAAGILSK